MKHVWLIVVCVLGILILSGCNQENKKHHSQRSEIRQKRHKKAQHATKFKSPTIPKTEINNYSILNQAVIAEVNRLRVNPAKYADDVLVPYLHSMSDDGCFTFKGKSYVTVEGKSAVTEAIKVLKHHKSVSSLSYSSELFEVANDHCAYQGKTQQVGHTRTDGTSFADHVKRLGLNCSGENISYGFDDAQMILIELLVDDGVSDRGHRKNLLNSKYDIIGVACGPHKKYQYMCVLDFGRFASSH
jgi:uncharacterized protein YkwD